MGRRKLTDEQKIVSALARKEYQKQWVANNPEKCKKATNKYHEKNKEIINQNHKQYRINNKDNLSNYHKQKNQQPKNKIKRNIKKSFNNQCIKRPKYLTYEILLGCTIEYAINHLQQTAIKNGYKDFDIFNYSGNDYNIDHIIPRMAFDMLIDEEAMKCCHYSNLQILTKKENLDKRKYDDLLYKDSIDVVKQKI
jgi:hypothetical protein